MNVKEIPIIKMDVDGFIRNFTRAVYKTIKFFELENCPAKEPVVKEWDLSQYYPKVKDFYKKVFNNSVYSEFIFCKYAELYEEYMETPFNILHEFKDKAIILFQSHQSKKNACYTHIFLNNIFPDFNVIIHNPKISKSIIPGVLIDDKPENIIDNSIGRSILIARPWNVNFRLQNEDLNVAHDNNDVIKHLKRILKEAY